MSKERNRQLEEQTEKIQPLCETCKREAKARWDSIFKPIDGLGKLEELIVQLCAIGRGTVSLEKKGIVILCGDNGIVEEGISQSTSDITGKVVKNMALGKATINQMAMACGADVIPVDMGLKEKLSFEGLWNRNIDRGTRNFLKGRAMEREQVLEAVLTGIELVRCLKEQGYGILGTGEMGIGNTTTTSAIASLLLKLPPEAVTGKGAGLDQRGIKRKIQVISQGIRLHFGECAYEREWDSTELLSCLGGYDLAGLTGVFLGGGIYRLPIVIDGAISACAALLARNLCKDSADYMLASHLGGEPCHGLLLEALGLSPVIRADLALGEGTGAVLLFPMLDMAYRVFQNEATFQGERVEKYKRYEE